MSFNKEHIDIKIIEQYFAGELSPSEMHSLEKAALDDPFLQEALDGYAANPAAIKRVKKHINNQKSANKSFFGSRTLAIIGIASLAYITVLVINWNKQDSIVAENPEINEEQITHEVEVIPTEIDTFIYAEIEEQITVDEISKNQHLITELSVPDQDSVKPIQNVLIDDPLVADPDLEIIEETNSSRSLIYAPATYVEDLYVVDYRRIKRIKSNISYTRYELTGVSAEFEDENARDKTELIEKEVEVPYMEYLEKSMYYFAVQTSKKALTRYLKILEQYPKDLNALFYGAHCYFNLKKYDKALEFFEKEIVFEKASGMIAFREEAQWYRAKTLIKLNRISEAKTVLDEIIGQGQFYAQEAILLRKKL
ncbi:MAG: CDC27 family protein [Crocinitomicaceae bacterium]